MKKTVMLVCIIVLLLFSFGCKGTKSQPTYEGFTQEELDQIAEANKKLQRKQNVIISDITMENGHYVGTISNTNTDYAVESVVITFAFYDEEGYKVDEDSIMIGKILAGETYKITDKAFFKKEGVTFKIIGTDINF